MKKNIKYFLISSFVLLFGISFLIFSNLIKAATKEEASSALDSFISATDSINVDEVSNDTYSKILPLLNTALGSQNILIGSDLSFFDNDLAFSNSGKIKELMFSLNRNAFDAIFNGKIDVADGYTLASKGGMVYAKADILINYINKGDINSSISDYINTYLNNLKSIEKINQENYIETSMLLDAIIATEDVILNSGNEKLDTSKLIDQFNALQTAINDLLNLINLAVDNGELSAENGVNLSSKIETVSLNISLIQNGGGGGSGGGGGTGGGTTSTCPTNISGYAWSEGIGWIDMCGVTYDINEANITKSNPIGTSEVSGYAWSENVGWIQFGGFSSFPTGGLETKQPTVKGLNEVNSRIYLSQNDEGNGFAGWARIWALSGDNDTETFSDWADGWISLRGKTEDTNLYGPICQVNHKDNVTNIPDGACAGQAWGGNVVGWIDFSNVLLTPFPVPKITLVANVVGDNAEYEGYISISNNQSISVHFQGENLSSAVNSCRVSSNPVVFGHFGWRDIGSYNEPWNGSATAKNFDPSFLAEYDMFTSAPFSKEGSFVLNISCDSSFGSIGGTAEGSLTVNVFKNCPDGYAWNSSTLTCDLIPSTDLCQNIPGEQASLPGGTEQNGQDCVCSGQNYRFDKDFKCINFRVPSFKER